MNIKDATAQRGHLFPTVSEFSNSFRAKRFWLIHKKSLPIPQPLMYSSNLNINIHRAFVTFKILLDVPQSILFQISTSNYAFQLITTDLPPSDCVFLQQQPMQLVMDNNACRLVFWFQNLAMVTEFWLTLSLSLRRSQSGPTWRWMAHRGPESSGDYAPLQPNNAGAKRSETGRLQLGRKQSVFTCFKMLVLGFSNERHLSARVLY